MDEQHLVQGSKKWLEWRQGKITATNACTIMNGVHFDETPLMLYNEKIAENPKEKPTTHAMEQGKIKEPLALAKFEEETGYLMNKPVKVHPTFKWMACSLDGFELDGSCALEIKCPLSASSESHKLALKGIVSECYKPQLQHIMEVCQLEEIYYMSYISDLDYTIFKVKKDHEYTERLIAAELEFWQRIQDKNPPDPTDRDSTEISSQEWQNLSNQYAEADEIAKSYQEKLDRANYTKDRIKNQLLSLSNNRAAHGAGIKLSKVVRRGHIDYGKIEALIGLDLEPYRKQSTEYWKVSFQGHNDEKNI